MFPSIRMSHNVGIEVVEPVPIASILTSQPKDFVVSTNQSLACLSASVKVSRDMPMSVAPLRDGE